MALFLAIAFALITILGVLTLVVRGADHFVRSIDSLLRSCGSLRRTWRAFRDDSPGVPASIEPPAELVADPLKPLPEAVRASQAAETSA
jgi:hypothetical protein